MTRITAALLLAFAGAALAALPPDKAAALDGAYTAIHQKTLTGLQQAIARGQISAASVKADIDYNTNAINQARARYVNSPYKKIFDQAYQAEMNKKAVAPPQPPVNQPPTLPPSTNPPRDSTPPYHLPEPLKAIFFVAALWGGWKIWQMPAKPVHDIDLNRYAPVMLSAADHASMAAAGEQRDARLAQIETNAAIFRSQIAECQAQLAWLASRAASQADSQMASAANALNKVVPDYEVYLESLEYSAPTMLAPWTSGAWKNFIENPQPKLPFHLAVAHARETLLSGEKGICSPLTVALLAAKGPIIVRCDAASKDRARAVIHNILLRAALGAPAEVRFSLIDPFGMGAGFPMRKLLPRVRPSAPSSADELFSVIEEIRRVNESVVGQAERFSALTREQRAGVQFEIIAVLDYPGEYQRDRRALDYLARIGQSGPRAGRHLILECNGAASGADLPNFQNAEVIDVAGAPPEWQYDPVAPPEMREKLLSAVNQAKSESTAGDWNALVRPQKFFSESAARMAATPVGERLTIWFGENQQGTPCAHGMLAGQTGSGKSVLLHVMITGFAARYSPQELQLVLVDGKQGVEFENYRRLPHAQVVCLRTTPAIARSVLEDFVGEMDDRNRKFQQAGVTKLEEYRKKTGLPMPRMLMIVDEYQQLLEGDSEKGSQLLLKLLEKGRAAGLHLLLGSQTFEVRGLNPAAMTQAQLRIALALPGEQTQGLSVFGNEGRDLIRDLTPPGQVVINDKSGANGANQRGAVAVLGKGSAPTVAQVVAAITTAAGSAGNAIVLSGKDPSVLADNPFIRQWKSSPPDAATLQTVAQKLVRDGGFGITSWSVADRPLPLWLGRKFDVRGHAVAALKRGPNQNLLALGSNAGIRLMMLANALAALRSMRSLKDARILFLDGLATGQAGEGMLAAGLEILRDAGAQVDRAVPDTAAAALEAFSSSALQPPNPESVRLLILSEPAYFPALAAPATYGAPPTGVARIFRDLLRNGPVAGVHTIVTAAGLSATTELPTTRDLPFFNHRMVQQTNDDESSALFAKTIAAQIQLQTDDDRAALYVDMVQGVKAGQLFKAYAANSNALGDQTAADLSTALRSLYNVAS